MTVRSWRGRLRHCEWYAIDGELVAADVGHPGELGGRRKNGGDRAACLERKRAAHASVEADLEQAGGLRAVDVLGNRDRRTDHVARQYLFVFEIRRDPEYRRTRAVVVVKRL